MDGFDLEAVLDDMSDNQFWAYDTNMDSMVDLFEFTNGEIELNFFATVLSNNWM
jgi:hypothetical protein